MTDMPEFLWAWYYKGSTPWCDDEPDERFVGDRKARYIRADLHEALQAENAHLKALVESLQDEILEMGEQY